MDYIKVHDALSQARAKGMNCHTFNAVMKDKATIEGIKANPYVQYHLRSLERDAEKYRPQPIPALPFSLFSLYDKVGTRKPFDQANYLNRERLAVFAAQAWLYGREEDIQQVEDSIWAICDEYSWSIAAHMSGTSLSFIRSESEYENGILKKAGMDNTLCLDLVSTTTAYILAEVTYLLEDKLAPVVVERARKEVFRRVIKSFMEEEALKVWELINSNWCAVCAGNIGCCALYLIDDDDVLANILSRLFITLEQYIDGFEEDGASSEGLGYWHYGMAYYIGFAELLYRRTDGAIDLLAGEKCKKILEFSQKCYFKGGTSVSFADGVTPQYYYAGMACYCARRFENVYLPASDECQWNLDRGRQPYRWLTLTRDLMWIDETIQKTVPPTACDTLPCAQWLLCRSENGVGFAAKGGHNAEMHNHNDVGSFSYHQNGAVLFADIGSGEYTKEYFGEKRYDVFCNGSQGHSVPLVDGKTQLGSREACARDCRYEGDTRMTIDIAAAYGLPALEKLERDFAFCKEDGGVTLQDRFVFAEGGHTVTERFITFVKPLVEEEAVLLHEGEAGCRLCFDAAQAKPKITEVDFVNHDARHIPVYCIDFEVACPAGGEVACRYTIQAEN